jgi:hypothetical protein
MHMEVGRTLLLSPSTYRITQRQSTTLGCCSPSTRPTSETQLQNHRRPLGACKTCIIAPWHHKAQPNWCHGSLDPQEAIPVLAGSSKLQLPFHAPNVCVAPIATRWTSIIASRDPTLCRYSCTITCKSCTNALNMAPLPEPTLDHRPLQTSVLQVSVAMACGHACTLHWSAVMY